jgi:hypothetical protein
MQVHLETPSREALALRDHALQRVRFVLRRLTWAVPRADVRLMDLNGPRGGMDKQCRIELRTPGSGPLVVTAVARQWQRALDEALSRAAHGLRRALGRRREPARGVDRGLAWPQ